MRNEGHPVGELIKGQTVMVTALRIVLSNNTGGMAPESLNSDTRSASELETNKVAKQMMNSWGILCSSKLFRPAACCLC